MYWNCSIGFGFQLRLFFFHMILAIHPDSRMVFHHINPACVMVKPSHFLVPTKILIIFPLPKNLWTQPYSYNFLYRYMTCVYVCIFKSNYEYHIHLRNLHLKPFFKSQCGHLRFQPAGVTSMDPFSFDHMEVSPKIGGIPLVILHFLWDFFHY